MAIHLMQYQKNNTNKKGEWGFVYLLLGWRKYLNIGQTKMRRKKEEENRSGLKAVR